MKEIRRLKITTLVRRVVRYQPPVTRAFCPTCAREVEMLGVAQAIALLRTDLTSFNCLLAAGPLHAIATSSGSLCVCLDSLFVWINSDAQ